MAVIALCKGPAVLKKKEIDLNVCTINLLLFVNIWKFVRIRINSQKVTSFSQ